VPVGRGKEPERHLTTLFRTIEPAEIRLVQASDHKKHGWLPILTVLFLISYGLMTMLIVEQGQTIDSQRALIRELIRDSRELAAVKSNGHEQQRVQAREPVAPHRIAPQIPSTQAPANKKAPSSQAGSQSNPQSRAAQQKPFRMPAKPASDVGDNSRVLVTI
jgi:hypothetical protein